MRRGLKRGEKGRVMRTIAAGVMALGMMSCGPSGSFVQPQEREELVVEIEAVPDSEIPTDGSIHVSKRGDFVIGQTTLFCGVDAEVDPALKRIGVRGLGIDGRSLNGALQKMGQSTQHSDGSGRQRMLDGKHCFNDGKNVIYSGRVSMNRNGKPYRLTLVIRQGQALWQGIVERTDGLVPGVFAISDEDGKAAGPSAAELSINGDSVNLTRKFSNYLESGAY
jgi:hypothetical protein